MGVAAWLAGLGIKMVRGFESFWKRPISSDHSFFSSFFCVTFFETLKNGGKKKKGLSFLFCPAVLFFFSNLFTPFLFRLGVEGTGGLRQLSFSSNQNHTFH